ncbi:MAG: hypothetical protein KKD28_06465 [Chloroflexi bacterium]|nr:hypothetical protein [Chloroflexota bacterium]MBU1661099.1 hypothetical protein [Chloroflexota bacterium]
MTTTIAQMTKEEFEEMIDTTIERKLLEILSDPDRGFKIRENIRVRLLHQKEIVVAGERGQSFDDVARQLG